MPSSEEESQWLVGSGGGGLAPSGGNATKTGSGEHILNTRTGLYTEEMTTQPASVTTAGVNSASADSVERDLIDSTDMELVSEFHERAITQVMPQSTVVANRIFPFWRSKLGILKYYVNLIIKELTIKQLTIKQLTIKQSEISQENFILSFES